MDNYHDEEIPVRGFTVGKLFKWLGVALILLVYAALFYRCMSSRDTALVSKMLIDNEVESAYAASPETFRVEQYGMNSAWVAVEERRLIEFNKLYYLPAARQLQFSVKYNYDIAENTFEDGTPFRFFLTDENGTRYDDYYFETASKSRYRFLRVSFKGIDLEKDETDPETGLVLRHVYTLHITRPEYDGTEKEYTNYKIYDGETLCKDVTDRVKLPDAKGKN